MSGQENERFWKLIIKLRVLRMLNVVVRLELVIGIIVEKLLWQSDGVGGCGVRAQGRSMVVVGLKENRR